MTLTAEEVEARKSSLGASDMPAVMGVNPYRSAVDVWLEKTGRVEPFAGNEFTTWGNRLEPVILDEYSERMGVEVQRNVKKLTHPDYSWATATPDGIVDSNGDGKWGVEVKNRNAHNAHAWGEPGSDEIPDEVAVQCHWSMFVSGLRRWHACALIGGNQLSIYHLEYDKTVADNLLAVGADFWENNIVADVCPVLDGSESSTNYVAGKWKKHGELIIPADVKHASVAEELREVRALIDEYKEDEARFKNLLKDFIGDAAGMSLPSGKNITWKSPKPGEKTDWKGIALMLKNEVPDGYYDEVVSAHTKVTSPSRRFLCPRNWSE